MSFFAKSRTLLIGVSALGCAVGCLGNVSQSQRLMDAASELNMAARFGRMDVAAGHTSNTSREVFLERRQSWGSDIRVLDVNLANLVLSDAEHAEVVVQYAWTRMNEGVLRNTSTKQFWENPKHTGWRMAREQRAGGDAGLFGEPSVARVTTPAADAHFRTKSLGSTQVADGD
jgi:hypothetical protein